jgi:hypothetical protein
MNHFLNLFGRPAVVGWAAGGAEIVVPKCTGASEQHFFCKFHGHNSRSAYKLQLSCISGSGAIATGHHYHVGTKSTGHHYHLGTTSTGHQKLVFKKY